MLKILPPIWFLIFLGFALLLHFFVPITHVFNLSGVLYKTIGVAVFIFGFFISNYASKQFAENKTEIIPTSPTNKVLVTDGIYKYTRNPMYVGMITSLIGIAFIVGTLPMFVAVFAQFVVLNFLFIPFEEKKLSNIFGDQYNSYKLKVRRWV